MEAITNPCAQFCPFILACDFTQIKNERGVILMKDQLDLIYELQEYGVLTNAKIDFAVIDDVLTGEEVRIIKQADTGTPGLTLDNVFDYAITQRKFTEETLQCFAESKVAIEAIRSVILNQSIGSSSCPGPTINTHQAQDGTTSRNSNCRNPEAIVAYKHATQRGLIIDIDDL